MSSVSVVSNAQRLRRFREHGIHVLGSFIFGLPSDRPGTFDATVPPYEGMLVFDVELIKIGQ